MNLKKLMGKNKISDSKKEIIMIVCPEDREGWKAEVTFGSIQEMIDNRYDYVDGGEGLIIGGDFNQKIQKVFSTASKIELRAYFISPSIKKQVDVKEMEYGAEIWNYSRYGGVMSRENEFDNYIKQGLFPINIDWYDDITYIYDKDYKFVPYYDNYRKRFL